jgi:hypothetical protein
MAELEGDFNLSSEDDSVRLQKPRVTIRKMRKGWWRKRKKENVFLEYKGHGGKEGEDGLRS